MSTTHHGMTGPLTGPITRRTLLAGATAVAATVVTGGTAHASDGQVPSLWREFRRTPFTHPQIPYVGRAGAARIRRLPVVADVRAYGAGADGVPDCAPASNRALAA
ncbi:hypothetical protein ACFV23_38310, partial [Streptomyces sp. NPDC059627]